MPRSSILTIVFSALSLGTLTFVGFAGLWKKVISPRGEISWPWFLVNYLLFGVLALFVVTTIALQLKSSSENTSTGSNTQPPSLTPKSPLASLSDGQRFVLKQKLRAYSGRSVRLILIGNDPQSAIAFEQLVDIFGDSGWNMERAQIAVVSVSSGVAFPSGPYLTSTNIASGIVENVFSIFWEQALTYRSLLTHTWGQGQWVSRAI